MDFDKFVKILRDYWPYFIVAIIITAPICWKIACFLNKQIIKRLEEDKLKLEENERIVRDELNNLKDEYRLLKEKLKHSSFSPYTQSNKIYLSCSEKLISSSAYSKVFKCLTEKYVSFEFVKQKEGEHPPNIDLSIYYLRLNISIPDYCALFIVIDDTLEMMSNNNKKYCFETEYDCAFFKNIPIYTYVKDSMHSNLSVKRISSLQVASSNKNQVDKKITHYVFKDDLDLLTALNDSIFHLSSHTGGLE